MGKYIKLIVGILLVVTAVIGGANILGGGLQKAGQRIVENGVDTVGVVDKRVKHTVGVKVNRVPGMTAYYMLHYSFTADDGKTYGDSTKVTKEQAYALQDGQKLRIRYMRGQPTINSVLNVETYMTAEEANDVPYGTVAAALSIFFFGGLWLIWSGWKAIGFSAPSFGRKGEYQLDRAVLLNGNRSNSNGPMFGGRR